MKKLIAINLNHSPKKPPLSMLEIYYQGFSQIIILHLLIALFEQSKKFGFSYKVNN